MFFVYLFFSGLPPQLMHTPSTDPRWPSYVIYVQAGKKSSNPFPQASCCFHRDSVLHAQGEWNTSAAPVIPVLSPSGYHWPPAPTSSPNRVTLVEPVCGHLAVSQLTHIVYKLTLVSYLLYISCYIYEVKRMCSIFRFAIQQNIFEHKYSSGMSELNGLAFCKTMPHSQQSPVFNI